jgi:hypothetical protein
MAYKFWALLPASLLACASDFTSYCPRLADRSSRDGRHLFGPQFTLAKLNERYGPNTIFLTCSLGWLLLFVSLVAGLAFKKMWQGRRGYAGLCYLLGRWWLGISLGIYILFKRPESLMLSSAKDFTIILLTW